MTNLDAILTSNLLEFIVYSWTNGIQPGFKQVKNELGWVDDRRRDYLSIERWWEIILSVYLLVSIHTNYFDDEDQLARNSTNRLTPSSQLILQFQQYRLWNNSKA